ncbi:hypothetical protein BBI10_09455 [Pseudomonas graminis]|uniref:Uncharacterized protein n=1 Tax=Pseudomonas graminis TaxID=158627 RepID=A0A1C2E6T8_9PSED|nr:hypothetical protein BBI10_09455 [Pseudomonas graminis]
MSFLITITSVLTGMCDRAAMVGCAYELQLYMTTASGVEINRVQMLCPPNLTRSGKWSLEDLDQIICFQGVATQESAVVYRTSGGVYKMGELDLRKKKTSQVWFSKKRLENHRPRISEAVPQSGSAQMYAPLYLRRRSSIRFPFA